MAARKAAPAKKRAAVSRPRASADPTNDTAAVDAYMEKLEHPLKAEVEAVRAIIKKANSKIGERIKWNSPSFFYKKDMAAFHLRASGFVHLIVIFPQGMGDHDQNTLLEGKHVDRREVKFLDMRDIQSKKKLLEKLVNDWITTLDAAT